MEKDNFCSSISFRHPEALGKKRILFPVFMPYAGCKARCIFCAQEAQTGQRARLVHDMLGSLHQALDERCRKKAPAVEVAFFGGTFTALPLEEQKMCLQSLQVWRDAGAVQGVRCSTRPDAVTPDGLEQLKKLGLTTVELGIQSFGAQALRVSRRGYSPAVAVEACRTVRAAGLGLGIQLMPGLPGQEKTQPLADVSAALQECPHFVRLYPCLVFTGTALESFWRAGEYQPLGLEETTEFLARACLAFWQQGVPVIRMGIAPEPAALANILAGPFHPALGSSARGLALFYYVAQQVARLEASLGLVQPKAGVLRYALAGPRKYQGEFWGHKGSLRPRYGQLGILSVCWEDREDFVLHTDPNGDHLVLKT